MKKSKLNVNIDSTSRKDFFRNQLQKEDKNNYRRKFTEEHDLEDDELIYENFCERIKSRLPDSSLFIFYKKSKIRQWCMKLAEPPDNLMIVKLIEKAGSYKAYLKE